MLSSYEDVKNYLKAFSPYVDGTAVNAVGSHKDLGEFIYGDEDRVIETISGNTKYPILWTPQVEHRLGFNGGSSFSDLSITLAVLANSEVFHNISEDEADTLCHTIAFDLVTKIIEDSDKDIIAADLDSFVLSPITHAYHANLFGWELKFTLKLAPSLCVNASKFN